MTPAAEPTGILIRLSVDRDGKAESPDRHLADCRSLLAEKGWHEVEGGIYLERDISGSKDIPRPEFDRLVRDLRRGHVKNLVAWDWSRITRRGPKILDKFFEAVDGAGGQILTYHQRITTGDEDMDRWLAHYFAIQAKKEAEAISRRVGGYMGAKAERGELHGGGTKPYAQNRDGSWIEDEAVVVLEMIQRVLAGESMNSIAKLLNERGLVTATGRPWSSSSIGMLLRQPRLAGWRRHNGKLIRGVWTPLVDQATFDRLQETLAARGQGGRRQHGPSLLTGLIWCGACGGPMVAHEATIHGKKLWRYACQPTHPGSDAPGCNKIAIVRAHVDGAVIERVREWLAVAGGHPLPAKEGETVESLESALSAVQGRLKDWNAEFRRGGIEREEWLDGKSELEDEVADLKARVETLASRVVDEDVLDSATSDAWWDDATPEQQRAGVKAAVAKVTIMPSRQLGGRFDTERVRTLPTLAMYVKINADPTEEMLDAVADEGYRQLVQEFGGTFPR